MKRYAYLLTTLLVLFAILLSACGSLQGNILTFRTADPGVSVAFFLLPAPDPTPCEPVIKGNVTRDNRKLYHLPGMPNYNQVVPEEVFCTEADAQAAGFERAGN